MSNGKKYSAFTIHNADGFWVARVVRRKTSKGSLGCKAVLDWQSVGKTGSGCY